LAKKVSADTTVRINAYPIIQDAVANGVAYGVRRAYKHTDDPTQEQISTEVENAVMSALCEVLQFGNGE
jgi:hypothetical protein